MGRARESRTNETYRAGDLTEAEIRRLERQDRKKVVDVSVGHRFSQKSTDRTVRKTCVRSLCKPVSPALLSTAPPGASFSEQGLGQCVGVFGQMIGDSGNVWRVTTAVFGDSEMARATA